MVFAKIKDGICINIMEFNSRESASTFDAELVELEEGYGIGDCYKDEKWSKPELTEEEIKEKRMKEIKEELVMLDATINRATEDLYTLTKSTPYQSTKEVIDKKEKLRLELQNLNKGEDNNEETSL